MKREEVREKFPDATDEQVDWLMGEAGKDVQREKQKLESYKADVAGRLEELESLREVAKERDELAQQNMSAEERVQKALEKAEKAKAEYAAKSNRLDAEKLMVEAGIPSEEYAPLLDSIVSEDAERTLTAAELVATIVASQREAEGKKVRSELIDATPKPQAGGGEGGEMSKEEFKKLPLAEKQRIATENPDLYNSFYSEQ